MSRSPTLAPTNPFAGSSPFFTQSSQRRGSSARVQLERFNSLAPQNDYGFHDVGMAPEREATKETGISASTNITPLGGFRHDEDFLREDIAPNIYQTHRGRRRAQLPDPDDDDKVEDVQPNGLSAPQVIEVVPRPRRSHWRRYKAKGDGAAAGNSKETPTLWHVMLHRGKETKIVLNATRPQAKIRSQIESQNYVSWQHLQMRSMALDDLEHTVVVAKAQGVQDSEIVLTHRLVRRVRQECERHFIGGSFLIPRSVRYDSKDSSKYSADKSCMFVAFPYFAVTQEQPRSPMANAQGDEKQKHPMRTLLQSIYRLNDTSERDQSQSIRMLSPSHLQSCIDTVRGEDSGLSRTVNDEMIYVPQLWAVILGSDRLMTFGPISDRSLQGTNILLRENNTAEDEKCCSLVRIHFRNQQRVENLTYPIQQCASWFGLLNKQQQIRAALEAGTEKSNPEKYKLYLHGHIVEAKNWVCMQRSTQSEVLNLWMETPKETDLKVSTDNLSFPEATAGATERKGSSTHEASTTVPRVENQDNVGQHKDEVLEEESDEGVGEDPPSAQKYEEVKVVPIVQPFLEWRIIDEFDEKNECSAQEVVKRFLSVIYRNLCAEIGESTAGFNNWKSTGNVARVKTATAREKPHIKGRTFKKVEQASLERFANKPVEEGRVANEARLLLEQLANAYFRTNYDENSAPLSLFWGAAWEVFCRASPSYMVDLRDKLFILREWVKNIHLGVLCRYREPAVSGRGVDKNTVSDGAVLLSSIVDAFGSVFNLLIAAAGELICDAQLVECGKKVQNSFEEALKLFATARDELIVEASGVTSGESIGPVLTPEAVLLMQLERLVCGVYRNGNVDMIKVYEECLEHLSLKVRFRYSRRLLQMINAFEEEVAAVHAILKQQVKVLKDLDYYLDPEHFDTPSTARRMRYEYEHEGIKRILSTLQDQVKNCKELQERAKVLAEQNVHLIETLQDDNGRAIFIFTFITILFLPLSFISSFFGMNLRGIVEVTHDVSLFWKIALPATSGIVLMCVAVIVWGEGMWFGLASIPRHVARMYLSEKMVTGCY